MPVPCTAYFTEIEIVPVRLSDCQTACQTTFMMECHTPIYSCVLAKFLTLVDPFGITITVYAITTADILRLSGL